MVGDKIASQEQPKIVLLWANSRVLMTKMHGIRTATKKIEQVGEKLSTTAMPPIMV